MSHSVCLHACARPGRFLCFSGLVASHGGCACTLVLGLQHKELLGLEGDMLGKGGGCTYAKGMETPMPMGVGLLDKESISSPSNCRREGWLEKGRRS